MTACFSNMLPCGLSSGPLSPPSLNHVGLFVWSLCNVGWLMVTLWCAGRIAHRVCPQYPFWTPAVTVLLLSRPLIEAFSNGQSDLWWGGLVTLFLYFELHNRPALAGLALALAGR